MQLLIGVLLLLSVAIGQDTLFTTSGLTYIGKFIEKNEEHILFQELGTPSAQSVPMRVVARVGMYQGEPDKSYMAEIPSPDDSKDKLHTRTSFSKRSILGRTTVIHGSEPFHLKKMAKLRLKDHNMIRIYQASRFGDSLLVRRADNESEMMVPIQDVEEIFYRKRIKGAIEGGVLSFAFTYLLVEVRPFQYNGDGDIILVPILIFGGPVLGFIIGAKERYVFDITTDPTSLPQSGRQESVAVHPQELPSDPSHDMTLLKAQGPAQSSLEAYFSGLLNQVEFQGFWLGSPSGLDYVMAANYRRYFTKERLAIMNAVSDDRRYFSIGWRDASGGRERGGLKQSWNTGGMDLSLGREHLWTGNSQKGLAGFYEIGLAAGFRTIEDDESEYFNQTNENGIGLIGAVGCNTWSKSVQASLKVRYVTIGKVLIPTFGLGYRF